jgi:hypothetical protein
MTCVSSNEGQKWAARAACRPRRLTGSPSIRPPRSSPTSSRSILPFKNAKCTNSTYGAAGDRDGNGRCSTCRCAAPKSATSLLEKDDVTKVIVPVYRDSMMGVMTPRSEADLAALKTAAK